MNLTAFKKSIQDNSLPDKMVWVDQNHTLVNHYLDNISSLLNRRIVKVFSSDELISVSSYELDPENVIYLSFFSKKEIDKVRGKIPGPAIYIFIVDDEEIKTEYETIVFGSISRNACLLFLEDYVKIKKTSRAKKEDDSEVISGHLSREILERLVDYFENNLDLCMNEIKKVEVLELQGSWEKPFEAILDCLPKKDTKMRSLKWFSGGDVDTCQVLYNIYIKKLRTLTTAMKSDQDLWAKLVRESIWCEACIVSGLIGDYVVDYLKLIESSLPEDFEVEYYPPVFHHELKNHPEWGI